MSARDDTITRQGRPETTANTPQETDPRPIDTLSEVVTPENVQFRYQLAGPAARTFAFSLDALIKIACLAVIYAIFTTHLGELGWGFYLVALFAIEWGYFVLFEIQMNGQSPGKRMSRLRVISENGTPMTWQQSILRNLLRPADQLPLFYAVGGTVMLFTKRFQRLGDLAAGTIVIIENQSSVPPPHLAADEMSMLVERLPASLRTDPELRKAALLYAGKRNALSRPLCRELARPVSERLGTLCGLPADTDPDLVMSALYRFLFAPDVEGKGSNGEDRVRNLELWKTPAESLRDTTRSLKQQP